MLCASTTNASTWKKWKKLVEKSVNTFRLYIYHIAYFMHTDVFDLNSK